MSQQPNPRFLPTEHLGIEQQAAIAMRLRESGAHINALGTLVITQSQLEQAQLTGDPLSTPEPARPLTEAELFERRHYLDQAVLTLGSSEGQVLPIQARIALMQENLTSLRDLFVVGKSNVSYTAGIGEGTLMHLEDLIGDNSYGIVWQENPTVEDIASLCGSLEEVHALALNQRPVDGQGRLIVSPSLPTRLTLQDILDLPAADLKFLTKHNQYLELKQAAQLFSLSLNEIWARSQPAHRHP